MHLSECQKTMFKKPFSPVFLNNYQQKKTKKYADIAKETACEKIEEKKLCFSWNSHKFSLV